MRQILEYSLGWAKDSRTTDDTNRRIRGILRTAHSHRRGRDGSRIYWNLGTCARSSVFPAEMAIGRWLAAAQRCNHQHVVMEGM